MASMIDTRIVTLEIEVAGGLKRIEGASCVFTVSKTGNGVMNEADIKVANLAKHDRDYLISATSPLKRLRERKSVTLYAGYVSTGVARLFRGDITAASLTQPPDIWLQLKAKTGYFARGQVVSRQAPEQTALSALAAQVASDMDLRLDFQAGDKQVENYSFTGGNAFQVDKLGKAGLVNAYIDDDALVVTDDAVPLAGKMRRLSEESGMIGIPEITEQGIKVKMLFDTQTTIGTLLDVQSRLNPSADGRYVIHRLQYNGASRDTPFYIEAEGRPERWRGRFI